MDHFQVPYYNFTNYFEGDTGNYFYINEKYYPAEQVLTAPGKRSALNDTALRQACSRDTRIHIVFVGSRSIKNHGLGSWIRSSFVNFKYIL